MAMLEDDSTQEELPESQVPQIQRHHGHTGCQIMRGKGADERWDGREKMSMKIEAPPSLQVDDDSDKDWGLEVDENCDAMMLNEC